MSTTYEKKTIKVKLSGPKGETIFEGTDKEFHEAAKRVAKMARKKSKK